MNYERPRPISSHSRSSSFNSPPRGTSQTPAVAGQAHIPGTTYGADLPLALQSGSVTVPAHVRRSSVSTTTPVPAFAPNNNGNATLPLSSDRVRMIPSERSAYRTVTPPYGSARQSRSGSGDDGVTLGPYDSISNAGEHEASDAAVSSFNRADWQQRDPYAQATATGRRASQSRVGYNTAYYVPDQGRPRSGSGGEGAVRDPRESVSQLPLIPNASGPAGFGQVEHNKQPRYDEDGDSIIDGDTLVGERKNPFRVQFTDSRGGDDGGERGLSRYPPSQPYDHPDEKADDGDDDGKGAGLLAVVKRKSNKRPNVWLRQIRDTTPLEQKIYNHKHGIGVQERAWACYVLSVILVIVFIVELVKSAQVTGKAIETSPFNYMIGPSSEMLINLGARFTACMREVPEISSMPFECIAKDTPAGQTCSLETICGFGGFGADGKPHQTFRFFTPLWLHVGVVHLLLNGLVLLTSSRLVEKQMGTLKFMILYLATGVFGFVLGGTFALSGLASMGASGAIFGTHAAVGVDLVLHWSLIERPGRLLFALLFEIIVGIGLGYIPGIDNFSHIGGFAMGLLLSIILLPAIHQSRRRRITIYVLRVIALVGACVLFGVLVNNFFTADPNSVCQWCRYLSCWPTANNNRCKGTGLRTVETTTTTTVNGSLMLIYSIVFLSSSWRRRSQRQH